MTSVIEELKGEKASLIFERKLETVTAGLPRGYINLLQNNISKEDALTMIDYVVST